MPGMTVLTSVEEALEVEEPEEAEEAGEDVEEDLAVAAEAVDVGTGAAAVRGVARGARIDETRAGAGTGRVAVGGRGATRGRRTGGETGGVDTALIVLMILAISIGASDQSIINTQFDLKL